MRFIFGRFIDCFILWLLGMFHIAGDRRFETFWRCLSANALDTDFFISSMVSVFTDPYHAELWKLFAGKAWDEFIEDVLVQDGQNSIEAFSGEKV